MSNSEIQERNIEIAKMLGWKRHNHASYFTWTNLKKPNEHFYESVLQFDSNWNWLMEAVEFIKKLGGSYSINDKSCVISTTEPYWFNSEIIVKTNESTHTAAFIAVSDFAKKIQYMQCKTKI